MPGVCFFGDVWPQFWFKLTKSMIQPYSFRNWMGPSLQFQAYAQYLEYSLGIFGCNVAFDDDRQQRIAQPRRFYWTIHTHRTTNVKNREKWFLVQCLPKSTHSQWLADDGPKSPKQLSWPEKIYRTRKYFVNFVCVICFWK